MVAVASLVAGCLGSDSAPDAQLQLQTDASAPDASAPDATPASGRVAFSYVLLNRASDSTLVPLTCAEAGTAGVTGVRLLLGDDRNENHTLEDAEILEQEQLPCNQADGNHDNIIEAGERGRFDSPDVAAGSYGLFAIEVTKDTTLVPWATFDVEVPATRVAFAAGANVKAGSTALELTFAGDTSQLAKELQVFLPVP
jgi:hypothetical protein